jgi:hypothetical protein
MDYSGGDDAITRNGFEAARTAMSRVDDSGEFRLDIFARTAMYATAFVLVEVGADAPSGIELIRRLGEIWHRLAPEVWSDAVLLRDEMEQAKLETKQ